MYNRYIPQGDGTFRKSREQEPREAVREPQEEPSPAEAFCSGCSRREKSLNMGIGSFLRSLLPQGLDTEDLLVILLLLLISGNDSRDGRQAMLTLGAYLFL